MGKIYAGQTDLSIELETGKPLAGITDVKIAYQNPNGGTGEFTAQVTDAVKGIIKYDVLNENSVNIVGDWLFWAKITDTQGLISYGEVAKYRVDKIGT